MLTDGPPPRVLRSSSSSCEYSSLQLPVSSLACGCILGGVRERPNERQQRPQIASDQEQQPAQAGNAKERPGETGVNARGLPMIVWQGSRGVPRVSRCASGTWQMSPLPSTSLELRNSESMWRLGTKAFVGGRSCHQLEKTTRQHPSKWCRWQNWKVFESLSSSSRVFSRQQSCQGCWMVSVGRKPGQNRRC